MWGPANWEYGHEDKIPQFYEHPNGKFDLF